MRNFVKIGKIWVEGYLRKHSELKHHGVKRQRWGVKNGPPYPLKRLKNANGDDIIVVEHTDTNGPPNGITQRVGKNGGIDRNYYDEQGRQSKQVTNNDHDKPKQHPFVEHGEHAYDYKYDENGDLISREPRELTPEERKENSDIL